MKFSALAAAAAIGFSGAAIAGPTVMTDTQLDNIVAGEDVSYQLWIKKNGDYKLYPEDNFDANDRNDKGRGNLRSWAFQDVGTVTCDDSGLDSSCSLGGQDFDWVWDDAPIGSNHVPGVDPGDWVWVD